LIATFGLNLGVDFKGGSVIELSFRNTRPTAEQLRESLRELNMAQLILSPTSENGFIIKTVELSEPDHQSILSKIREDFPASGLEEKKFNSIGPVIGQELKQKSIAAIILVLLAIIVYFAIIFRKLSRTVSGWVMGLTAIVALLHDILIPMAVFALLGYFYGIEISAVFVAAILTILGYSVSDTVVVFDRIRENIIRGGNGSSFASIVHKSVLQTLTRSLNTTFTTLLSLLAIFFFGGESIKYFSLALILGIFFGSYSSIFVATPLLVLWNKRH